MLIDSPTSIAEFDGLKYNIAMGEVRVGLDHAGEPTSNAVTRHPRLSNCFFSLGISYSLLLSFFMNWTVLNILPYPGQPCISSDYYSAGASLAQRG